MNIENPIIKTPQDYESLLGFCKFCNNDIYSYDSHIKHLDLGELYCDSVCLINQMKKDKEIEEIY